jgi:hypothetical protein
MRALDVLEVVVEVLLAIVCRDGHFYAVPVQRRQRISVRGRLLR